MHTQRPNPCFPTCLSAVDRMVHISPSFPRSNPLRIILHGRSDRYLCDRVTDYKGKFGSFPSDPLGWVWGVLKRSYDAQEVQYWLGSEDAGEMETVPQGATDMHMYSTSLIETWRWSNDFPPLAIQHDNPWSPLHGQASRRIYTC